MSFGLPNRDGINSAFLTMAMAAGMTSAITNPLHIEVGQGGHGRRCDARPRSRLRALDPPLSRCAAAGRRRCRRAGRARRGRGAARPPRRRASAPLRRASRIAWPPATLSSCSCLPASAATFRRARRLLQAARSLGVDIDSVCGGRALCGRCQVLVAEGEFAKLGVSSSTASLTELSEPEMRFSKRAPLAAGRRLSCSTRVLADVVIDVPESSQVHRQVVRKEADARAIELNPVVRLHYVQVKEPDMHDPSGDLRRLFEALEREWESQESRLRSGRAASPAGRIARSVLAGHGGGACGEANHRRVARAARGGIRSRSRYRLDHHRRASVRSDERRGRRLRGRS